MCLAQCIYDYQYTYIPNISPAINLYLSLSPSLFFPRGAQEYGVPEEDPKEGCEHAALGVDRRPE